MLVVVVFQQVMKQIFPLLLLTFCQILFLLPFVRRNDHNTTEKAQELLEFFDCTSGSRVLAKTDGSMGAPNRFIHTGLLSLFAQGLIGQTEKHEWNTESVC